MKSIALNDAVREYPYGSDRYRRVFNRKAEELGLEVRWKADNHNFNSLEPDEVYSGSAPVCFDPQTAADIRTVLQSVEGQRRELVHQSATLHRHIDFRAPLELLRPVERAAVHLINDEVKPVIDRLEANQHTSQAPAQASWMSRHGEADARSLFARFHRDQLAGPLFYDERASLLPTFPEEPPINGMIASDITMAEFQRLASQLPPDADQLRPTTMLSKNAQGQIESRPLALDPLFREDHLKLAASMEKLAALQLDGQSLDPQLQTQARAWAQYFRTGAREDEATAVQATIDAGEAPGLLRLHIGPSESYWADNVKFPYNLQVGIRDAALQKELQATSKPFVELEQSLAGTPGYEPRPVKTRGGFADPIYQAVIGGFVETFYAREVKGMNFPNYPYAGVEGSNRFCLLESMAPVAAHAREVAERLLDRVPGKLEETENMYAAFHESGHLLGPQRSHVTPGGLPMGLVFGADWGAAEEPKADLTVAGLLAQKCRDGQMTVADKRTHLEAATNILLSFYPGKRLFAEGKATDHYYGFLLQTGYYLQTGALSVVGERLHVDPDKIEASSDELWRKLITFQSLGQKDEFLAFGRSVIEGIPDSVDRQILAAQGDYRPYFVDHHL